MRNNYNSSGNLVERKVGGKDAVILISDLPMYLGRMTKLTSTGKAVVKDDCQVCKPENCIETRNQKVGLITRISSILHISDSFSRTTRVRFL